MGVSEDVARRLRDLRSDKGVTQVAVQEATGIPHRTVMALENAGQVNLPFRRVYALATFYGVHPLWLASGEHTRHRDPIPSLEDYVELVRDNLRGLRDRQGLGTKWVAKRAGVHQPWIVRIEGGVVSTLDLVRLDRVMKAMDLTLADLLDPGVRTT